MTDQDIKIIEGLLFAILSIISKDNKFSYFFYIIGSLLCFGTGIYLGFTK